MSTIEEKPTRYNVEALAQLRADLLFKAKTRNHDQGSWGKIFRSSLAALASKRWQGRTYKVGCPTTACAAGWTVTAAGAKMLFYPDEADAGGCLTVDGAVRSIPDYGAEILGLDGQEKDEMFLQLNTTRGVVNMIDELILAARHGITLDDWRSKLAMDDWEATALAD